jgi:molybdopterin/thiamine biosynthesis adenylyltransferase
MVSLCSPGVSMNARKARQGFLGPDSTEVLANARVGIVGNCGGGSHVAQQLAHVGIGHFVLIDPDVTEDPNLNRMIGSTPDDAATARLKTEVMERMIRGINSGAAVTRLNCRWQKCAEPLRECDVVFGCVDGYMTRSELEAYCRRFLLPYIDIGMDVTQVEDFYAVTGQIVTSLPGRACFRCMGFLTEALLAQEAARYGDAGPRPQVVWPNGVLGIESPCPLI